MARNDKKRATVIDLTGSSPIPASKVSRNKNSDVSSSQATSYPNASFPSYSSSQNAPSSSYQIPPSSLADNSQTVDDDYVEDGVDTDPTQRYQNSNESCLYTNMDAKIVGVRYYNGHVSPGEMVFVRREPHNAYDTNAIQVLNVRRQQIGHIPRNVASKLAPFLDRHQFTVEGYTTSYKGIYDCPIALQLYGSSDPVIRTAIKDEMKNVKLPTTELAKFEREEKARHKEIEKQRKEHEKLLKKAAKAHAGGKLSITDVENPQWAGSSSGSASTITMDDIINESQKLNPRSFEEMVEKFGLPETQLENMSKADQPRSIESLLLPFQRQGLAWMLEKESPKLPESKDSKLSVQLWKRSDKKANMFSNVATKYSTENKPHLASGGILADDMGLGKTIQVISLIMASRELKVQQSGFSSTTLIISPLSVMSNWTQQIERHVKEEFGLKVLVYHGNNRKEFQAKNVADWDVIVTTYDTIRTEHFGKNSKQAENLSLRAVKWRRIVLDEAHTIRNPAAKTTTAIHALKAQSRWALTGTPIVNSLKDLYSLVRFLGLSGGIETWELFNSAIIRPLNAGMEDAGELLQLLMNSICLRRKKDMKFIDLKLPELSEYIHHIDFHPHELEQYTALEEQARGTLEEYQQSKSGKKGAIDSSSAYRHLLEVLLRMRQFCNHWQLVGETRINSLIQEEGVCLELTSETRAMLEGMLKLHIESQEDCPICLETITDPVITLCTHIFCFHCIEKVIDGQHKCPMCRAPLEDTTRVLRLPEGESSENKEEFTFTEVSSKLDALLSILKASENGEGNKTVVFSQWTSFLDVVSSQLVKSNIKYARIDGTMSAGARDAAMNALEKDPSVTVLLASLGVCSVGLNLVAANQVILSDSWWAPAIEDQAVDRVHRLGQTRPTKVFRLVMSNSIEDKVLEIQKRKRKLMMLAFAEKKAKRGNEQGINKLSDIQTLLSPSKDA
jgi:SWI/SNF-related matrix-associated actin-dependent regulator of chromatin subfamily A3